MKNRVKDLFPNIPRSLLSVFLISFFVFLTVLLLPRVFLYSYNLPNLNNVKIFSYALVLALIFGISTYSLGMSKLGRGRIGTWLINPIVILMVAMLTRAIVMLIMGQDTNQISDFELAFYWSDNLPHLTANHRIHSGWTLILWIYRLFPTEMIAISVNILITGLSAVLLYACAVLAKLSPRVALLGALLFLLWPAHMFYTIITSPEFYFVFFSLLSVLLALLALESYKAGRKIIALILFIISGIILSIANFMTSVGILFIIAFLILHIINTLSNRNKEAKLKLSFLSILSSKHTMIIIAIFMYFLTTSAVFAAMESYTGLTINRSSLPHQVYTGLTFGHWSVETSIYSGLVVEYAFDFDAAGRETYRRLLEFIQENQNLSVDFFLRHKLSMAWASDNYMAFVNATMNQGDVSALNLSYWVLAIRPFIHYYYKAMMILFALSVAIAFFKRENGFIPFNQLALFGFMLALLIVEAQPRYKTVLYPSLAICAAYSIDSISVAVKNRLLRERKNSI